MGASAAGIGGGADVAHAKQAVRQRVWDALQAAGVAAFPGVQGRIPNTVGAGRSAGRLAGLPEWAAAAVLKANPDLPQLPVRARALADGKLVHLSSPRLRDAAPFRLLDPERLAAEGVAPRRAASIAGSEVHAVPVAAEDLPHLDLVVCGSVAVSPEGVRIGKGGGYADLELALCRELGVIDDATVIATTVHPLQVLDEDLPSAAHDGHVDLVVTPDEVLRCPRAERPPGILWELLDDERLAAMPAIAARRHR